MALIPVYLLGSSLDCENTTALVKTGNNKVGLYDVDNDTRLCNHEYTENDILEYLQRKEDMDTMCPKGCDRDFIGAKLDPKFSLKELDLKQYEEALKEGKVNRAKFEYGYVFGNLVSGYINVIVDNTNNEYVSIMHWETTEDEEYGNAMLIGSIETRMDYYGKHLGVFLVKDLIEKAKTIKEWDYIIVPHSKNHRFWWKMGFITVEEMRKKSPNKAKAVGYLARHSSIDYAFNDDNVFVFKVF